MVVSFKALSRSYVAAHTVGTLSVVIAALLGVQLIDLRDGRLSGA
jgi:hypothetical protein